MFCLFILTRSKSGRTRNLMHGTLAWKPQEMNVKVRIARKRVLEWLG